ncbi:hypothetical protein [Pseudochryseolinea flava]|uniref:Lipoprotein n=1 Tax=Pseudochryseolinea flava TaxID=2059302 RepID=A0A364XWE4_9BACT|nr:hypothetical protein [Pseudochryseolinea flava]RAV98509.1 hypothetical protein DQQ10_23600 [Pseudochryseolinea flava]
MKRMKYITTLLIMAATSLLMFCQEKKQRVESSAVMPVTASAEQDSMKVVGYTIHRVRLRFEYTAKDARGEAVKYKEAWLVKLTLERMLRYPSLRVEFAIGDYIIPEYGSWEKGIYFKVYDQATFDKLSHQEIKFRLPNSVDFISTKKQFEGAANKRFAVEDEREALKQ